MTNLKKKAKGHRGSWFADVDGESIPCVHQHWFMPGGEYVDPGVEVGKPIWDEFIKGLKATGKAIVTTDKVSANEREALYSGIRPAPYNLDA